MKVALLRLLACPSCGDELALHTFEETTEEDGSGGRVQETLEGVLACRCGQAYPVIDGVPRLLEGALYQHARFRQEWHEELKGAGALGERSLGPPSLQFRESLAPTMARFGKQWGAHPIDEDTWGLEQRARLEHALRYLGWRRGEASGRVILDAGCGNAKLTCGMATWGAEIVGVDISPGIVKGWRERRRWAGEHACRVHVLQADLTRPPFRRAVFDGIHSSGVLHHTPDTRQAFVAVAALVRPGGSFGVWLYGKDQKNAAGVPWVPFVDAPWASIRVSTLRRLTPRLPPALLHTFLLGYASIFHLLYTAGASIRGRRHPQSIRERTTSLFDSLAPPYVWRHTVEEVMQWFKEVGFSDIRETTVPGDEYGFCITGCRLPLLEPAPTGGRVGVGPDARIESSNDWVVS